jgi:hypothetical protein
MSVSSLDLFMQVTNGNDHQHQAAGHNKDTALSIETVLLQTNNNGSTEITLSTMLNLHTML